MVGVDELADRRGLVDPGRGREIRRGHDELLVVVTAVGQVGGGASADHGAAQAGCAQHVQRQGGSADEQDRRPSLLPSRADQLEQPADADREHDQELQEGALRVVLLRDSPADPDKKQDDRARQAEQPYVAGDQRGLAPQREHQRRDAAQHVDELLDEEVGQVQRRGARAAMSREGLGRRRA